MAGGGMSGSAQVAMLVNGEVYDCYFGTRSAAEVEQMILSSTHGPPYPFERCIRRKSVLQERASGRRSWQDMTALGPAAPRGLSGESPAALMPC